MASMRVDSQGGTGKSRRRREGEKEGAAGFYCDGDAAEDELGMLMPALKKRFQAFDDDEDDEGNLNFMGVPNMAGWNAAAQDDKENNGNSFRQFKRREGSGRVTTSRPIDFGKLLAGNRILVSPPSGSLCRNIATVLKENVNNGGAPSQIVDDFWTTERQRKISAVARRKLTGAKTPAKSKPQAVEDRHARHARSRRGGGNSRKLGKRPIKLDLYLDAAKISEWDQETLDVEEEVPCSLASSRAFGSAGRAVLEGNFSASDQGQNVVVPAGANGKADQDDEAVLREGSNPDHPREALQRADSPSSLPDMDFSPGESPGSKEQHVLSREEQDQHPVQDTGAHRPDHIKKKSLCERDPFLDEIMHGDSFLVEAMGQTLPRSPGPSRCSQENPRQEIISQGPQLLDSEEDPPVTPSKGFPVPDRSSHTPRAPVTSPTPPSNPVGLYMSLRRREGDVGQRRLAFLSSPSGETVDRFGSGKGQNLDFGEVPTLSDLCNGREPQMTGSQDDLLNEKLDSGQIESRRDLCNGGTDMMSSSKHDMEGEKLDIGEVESRGDLCSGGAHQIAATNDVEGEELDLGEAKALPNLCYSGTHQTTSNDDAEDELHSDKISPAASCEGETLREDQKVEELDSGEANVLPNLCRSGTHQTTSKDGAEDELFSDKISPATSSEGGTLQEVHEGEGFDSGEAEALPNLCHSGTHQTTSKDDAEDELHSDKIIPAASCEGETMQEDQEVNDLLHCEEIVPVTSCDRVTHLTDNALRTQKVGEEEEEEIHLYHSVQCEKSSSKPDQVFNSWAGSPSQGGNALLAISQEYAEDDSDFEVPDIDEAEPLHGTSTGTSQPEETLPHRSEENLEELHDKVATVDRADNSQDAPPPGDAEHNIATKEGLIWKDKDNITQTKPKRARSRMCKEEERRSSLEDSGSLWTDGQRRSQRIRVRPLEWWRGEKLLYGRVHTSLTTIIGIKHSSPGKYACGIKDPFIVESYVPAKYNELVRLAAI